MAQFDPKTRYKALGLVRYFEYTSEDRILGAEPAGSRLTPFSRPTAFESDLQTFEHVLKQNETLHHLALHYFGDARLWWFISDYNDGKTVFYEGDSVVIPPQIEVSQY